MDGHVLGKLRPVALGLDLFRLAEILRVLVRHGFSSLVTRLRGGSADLEKSFVGIELPAKDAEVPRIQLPERIRLVLQDLGPTFIKLGQILSTRSDLVPDDIIEEFKKLQDDVPPFEIAQVRATIEEELKKPLSELFACFEEQAFKAASIGQVHSARLPDGAEVVVKIQRPGIEAVITRDLHLMAEMAIRLERSWPELAAFDFPGVVEQFRRALMRELDYDHERHSAMRFRKAFHGNERINIPLVYKSHSSKRVMTMEMIHGVKITQAKSIGCDPAVLAQTAVEAVLTMVFEHGFFHADPHPGNIFAQEGNRIALLDLGMVGRLDEWLRFRLVDLIIALVENDVEAASRALRAMGRREAPIDRLRFMADVGEIMNSIVGLPIDEINLGKVIGDLFDGARRHRIKIPAECYLMGKAMLTVESVARDLDPNLDIESAIKPHLQRLVAIRLAPKRLGKLVWRRLSETADSAGELPGQITDLLESLQRGTLTVRVEPIHQNRTMNTIERLVQKLTYALIISALVLSSALFIIFSGFQGMVWGIPTPLILGFGGYIVAIILAYRLIGKVNRPDD